MIRWAGVITVVVIAAIIFILGIIFSDEWLEGKLEDLGASIVGAKVEIDDLEIALLEMKIQWQRLQVTDPKQTMKNMFETGLSTYDMEFWPLLSGKVIIESFNITGFKTYTDRETDGKIEKEDKPQVVPSFVSNTMKGLSDQVSGNVNMNLDKMRGNVDVDSIMGLLKITSGDKIDSLKTVVEQGYEEWNKKLSELNIEQDVKAIENKAKSIKLDNVKDPAQVQRSLKDAQALYKDIEKLTNQIDDVKTNLNNDISNAYASVKQVDDWIAQDYARARSMAKLPDFSVENIGKLLFGSKIVNRVNQVLGYTDKARGYAAKMSSDKQDKEPDPPRMKGQDIYFPVKSHRPKFWIKTMSLTGATNDGMQLEGSAQHIVSNQKQIGQPTVFKLSGGREDGSALDLSGELNYLEDTPREMFEMNYQRISLNHTKLSDSPLFPTELEKGVGAVKANLDLVGETIQGKIIFTGRHIKFDFKKARSGNDLNRMIRSAIQKINLITINARISGERDKLKFNLNSNLDKAITDNIKEVVGAEIDKAKKQIEDRVRKEVDKRKKELETTLKDKEEELQAEVKKYEAMIDKEKEKVDAKKKEVEKKIEEEKKKLEKGLKDKLKGIF